MSLAHGRPYLAIPGPSVMPDRVLREMHRAAPNIYEGDLMDMTASLYPDLRRVARTEHSVAIYICNGHGTWEASLANVAAPGDRVLVAVNGNFGKGWADTARKLGIEVEIVDHGLREAIDPARVAEALTADSAHRIKAVMAVHVDTSTSIRNDIAALRRAMDEAGHPALLMADCIASLGCDRFEMDAWGVDVMIAASQKGLMTPPGLGFVFISPKAEEARRALPRVSPYWDWAPRIAPEIYSNQFCGTAPTHHLFGLRAALDMIHEEGMENIWSRHETLARALWAACDAGGQGGVLELNMPDPVRRSHAVTAARLGPPDASRLRAWCETQAGVTLGIGLGMVPPTDPAWHGFFRFGHMGHINAHMMLGLIGTVEAGFCALDIAHGAGGTGAAARVIAGATGGNASA